MPNRETYVRWLRVQPYGSDARQSSRLAMLSSFIDMHAFGISANLMSLGAIDLGMIVDSVPAKMDRMKKPALRGRLFCVWTRDAGQKIL
jgi:hypothetical protein